MADDVHDVLRIEAIHVGVAAAVLRVVDDLDRALAEGAIHGAERDPRRAYFWMQEMPFVRQEAFVRDKERRQLGGIHDAQGVALPV